MGIPSNERFDPDRRITNEKYSKVIFKFVDGSSLEFENITNDEIREVPSGWWIHRNGENKKVFIPLYTMTAMVVVG